MVDPDADVEAPIVAPEAGAPEADPRSSFQSCWLGQQLAGTLFGVILGFLVFLLVRVDAVLIVAVALASCCGVYGVGTQHLGEMHVDAGLMGRTTLGAAAGAVLGYLPTFGDAGIEYVLFGSAVAALGAMGAFHFTRADTFAGWCRKLRTS